LAAVADSDKSLLSSTETYATAMNQDWSGNQCFRLISDVTIKYRTIVEAVAESILRKFLMQAV